MRSSSIIFLLLFFTFAQDIAREKTVLETSSMTAIKINPSQKKPLIGREKQLVGNTRQPAQSLSFPQNEKIKPPSLRKTLDQNNVISLDSGDKVLKNVRALTNDQYEPSRGSILYQDSHFTYFNSSEVNEGIPVAYDPVNESLHPISQILHIRNVDETLRTQLLLEGYSEYYYHEKLRLFSLESTPSEVLNLYRELKEQKLDVHLEIVKQTPKGR
jgi:hypothetical protein